MFHVHQCSPFKGWSIWLSRCDLPGSDAQIMRTAFPVAPMTWDPRFDHVMFIHGRDQILAWDKLRSNHKVRYRMCLGINPKSRMYKLSRSTWQTLDLFSAVTLDLYQLFLLQTYMLPHVAGYLRWLLECFTIIAKASRDSNQQENVFCCLLMDPKYPCTLLHECALCFAQPWWNSSVL